MTNLKSVSGFALAAVIAAAFAGAAVAAGGDGPTMLQRFDQIDTDKDGLLTEAEVQAFRAARFATADADKNGSLSAEELSAMQMEQMQERMAQRAARMVQRLDGNGDGQLSAEEFAKAGSGKWGRGKTMFQRADADGDGMISKAEAESAVQKMADRGGKHGKKNGQKDGQGRTD